MAGGVAGLRRLQDIVPGVWPGVFAGFHPSFHRVRDHDSYQYEYNAGYDLSGNIATTWGFEPYEDAGAPGGWSRWEDQAKSYYGADDNLRIQNRHLGIGPASAPGGVFEEYRYDALGRRVLVRSRCTGDVSSSTCPSYVERTVWDGDQVLYELRAKGSDSTPPALFEVDNAGNAWNDGNRYGTVGYTHAGGIDRPVSLVRIGLYENPGPIAVAPHANWQGDLEVGSCMNGQATTTCYPQIPWRGSLTSADGEWATPTMSDWWGGALSARTDGSGMQQMRNRYYDPETGRFTQEDPIGLAGGLNLYGFANGDPVNFSDPFGLCGLAGAAVSVGIGAVIGVATGGYSLAAAAVDAGSGAACVGAIAKLGKLGRLVARYGDDVTDGARALLARPNMVRHHIFNRFWRQTANSEKYAAFFRKHGIDVNDYAVEMTEGMHQKWIHGAGRDWTVAWKTWIDANPNATTKEVYQQAGRMMDEYGISNLPLVRYHR